jgi:hypothetical protein
MPFAPDSRKWLINQQKELASPPAVTRILTISGLESAVKRHCLKAPVLKRCLDKFLSTFLYWQPLAGG